MQDSKERFSAKVADYVKYRPTYPETALAHLCGKTGVKESSEIADIGSGTGKFTKLLLDKNLQVFGVEPNKNMRDAAEIELSEYPNFQSINGSAEATTLKDNSVDLITVAQAFHWFDRDKCMPEFRRILKNGGKVALIWNTRDKSSGFMAQCEEILKCYSTDPPNFAHEMITEEVFAEIFKTHETTDFRWTQSFDVEAFLGRVASSSYSPLPTHENYEPQKKALCELFEKYQKNGKVEYEYQTKLIIGEMGE